ncbi:MAG: DNA-binding protein [Ilumatobacteraceae bacterium]
MGLRDLGKRLKTSVKELDDQRLQERFHGVDITAMCDMTCRTPVRVGGEIIRMRVAPRSGIPAFEITVSDGTGSATAVFTGRRQLGGIEHNRAIVLEGVAHQERGRRVLLNPAYTLLPH